MFGRHIDYWLLRPFTHKRNLATEEELDTEFRSEDSLDADAATSRLKDLVARFDGRFPVDGNLRYLDVGCGKGDFVIALVKAGCRMVDGVDVIPRCIDSARLSAKRMGADSHANFYCKDIHCWVPNRPYDVVVSLDALEHISDPDAFLKSLGKLVTSDGLVFLAFGPLFHSRNGDHMWDFFRVPVPWRGALFSEKAILRLRRECFRPGDPAERYQDIVGGLNLMRYSQFLRHVDAAGWEIQHLLLNHQLKRIRLLHAVSNMASRTPWLRDYVTASVCAVLRPQAAEMQDGRSKRKALIRPLPARD